jgi:hypothetical protein
MRCCVSTLVRACGVMIAVGTANLALPFPAQAGGVHVAIGVGTPAVVAPAPVVVQPAPVVVPHPVVVQPAPVVVAEPYVVYRYPSHRRAHRHWKHHHRHKD